MKIELSKIDDIDLTDIGKKYIRGPYRNGKNKWGYREDAFFGSVGEEHYKLLAYFSTLFDNSLFVDIGTFRGYSAIALSYNKSNKIISYDPHESMYENSLSENPKNVEFKNVQILNDDKDKKLLLNIAIKLNLKLEEI